MWEDQADPARGSSALTSAVICSQNQDRSQNLTLKPSSGSYLPESGGTSSAITAAEPRSGPEAGRNQAGLPARQADGGAEKRPNAERGRRDGGIRLGHTQWKSCESTASAQGQSDGAAQNTQNSRMETFY